MSVLKFLTGFLVLFSMACATSSHEEKNKEAQQEVNVYSHRFYDADRLLYQKFEEKTGIKVNIKEDEADKLIALLQSEGENTQADVLITVDAGRLYYAKELGLSQAVNSEILNNNVPEYLRDADQHWFGLTKRARVILYNTENVTREELSTYEDLTNDIWKGQIFVRSGSNIYNQSLLASIISRRGEEMALKWAKGIVANMAREPKGNDRDQIKEMAAGNGKIAIANSYYLGKLLNSENEMEKKAGSHVGIFFPNQDSYGTHINISGGFVTKFAPNKENAVALLEFLTSVEAQNAFSESNFEYPVNRDANISELLQSWGSFKEDNLNVSELGLYNAKAIEIFKMAAWN